MELASRLSYFLWSSLPDAELFDPAASGRLHDPEVLAAQTRRMLARPAHPPTGDRVRLPVAAHLRLRRARRKERTGTFPTFPRVRARCMYEESIRFFTDLFQNDGSDARRSSTPTTRSSTSRWPSTTAFPASPAPSGGASRASGSTAAAASWASAATLGQAVGHSRPARSCAGNWVAEVLLGEKLPKPPKNVPAPPRRRSRDRRPDRAPTRREAHQRRPLCQAATYASIRSVTPWKLTTPSAAAATADLGDRPIDTAATLRDGTKFDGLRRPARLSRDQAAAMPSCGSSAASCWAMRWAAASQLSDEPLLEEMRASLQNNDYRFSAAVETIVQQPTVPRNSRQAMHDWPNPP